MVRWKGYLDWALSRCVQKTVKKDIKYLLWVGLYQISFMKKAKYHVVNESVEYAKQEYGPYVANFVNAILRSFLREKDGLNRLNSIDTANAIGNRQSAIGNLSITYSFPAWLTERWVRRFGYDETRKLLAILSKPPEFGIRANLNLISRDEVICRLEEKGISAKKGQYLESALCVDKLSQVLKDELFENRFIHVQDETSQLAGWSIGRAEGGFVLDACAGLGTKTEQIREQSPGATLIAMDNETKRLAFIKHKANLVAGDATNSPFKDSVFSAILLDAPCSSLGIIRKHPEIKWRRKEKDIAEFGDYQLNLMKSLWKKLKSGGHMVYSVCSFEYEETVSVIERFKKEETFILENPLPFLFNKEYFLSLPHETGMDGFFIARLKKI